MDSATLFNVKSTISHYPSSLITRQRASVDSKLLHTPRNVGYYHIFEQQEAFEKCWTHSPLRTAARRLILHCHSPGVATVARRLRIDVHDNDDNNNNDNA